MSLPPSSGFIFRPQQQSLDTSNPSNSAFLSTTGTNVPPNSTATLIFSSENFPSVQRMTPNPRVPTPRERLELLFAQSRGKGVPVIFGRSNNTEPPRERKKANGIPEASEDSIFIGLDEAIQRSRAMNQKSLFNNANPPALPATGNLTGRGGLFNNRSHWDYTLGLAPPPSNASIFSNSIPNTQYARLARHIEGPELPNREFFPKKDLTWVIGAKRIQNLDTNPDKLTDSSQTPSSSIFFSNSSLSASNNSVQALNNHLNSSKNAPEMNTNKYKIQVSPQDELANEEEEASENGQYSTTFAEDLQNLMANHQITAPENLFSNDSFTQSFVQFLKNFDIKVSHGEVLSHLPQEEPEAEINSQEEDVGTEKLGQYVLKASEIDDKYKKTF